MYLTKFPLCLYVVLIIPGIFLFIFRDMGYLGKLIMGIFLHLLKAAWSVTLEILILELMFLFFKETVI